MISARTAIVSALACERAWPALLETALDTLELIRDRRVLRLWESFFLMHVGAARLGLGDVEAARAAAAEGVANIRRAGGFWSPNSYAVLARAQLALHEPSADIAATLDEYSTLLARTGFALFEGELHELRALLADREGQDDVRRAARMAAHAAYNRFGMQRHIDRLVDHFGNLGETS
jgi:hypothetical protein